MKYEVWYMKPDWFAQGTLGSKPDKINLHKTHTRVITLDIDKPAAPAVLEQIWCDMQAEVWSPNGEARSMIEGLGLQHTSMSMGDIIKTPDGKVYRAAMVGFEEVP